MRRDTDAERGANLNFSIPAYDMAAGGLEKFVLHHRFTASTSTIAVSALPLFGRPATLSRGYNASMGGFFAPIFLTEPPMWASFARSTGSRFRLLHTAQRFCLTVPASGYFFPWASFAAVPVSQI